MERLRKLNIGTSVIQAALCILCLVYLIYYKTTENVEVNLEGMVLESGSYYGRGEGKTIFVYDVSLIFVLLALFSAITCGFHSFYASRRSKSYQTEIKKGTNRFRWIEYSITATIMLVVIALSSGVFDLEAQAFIAACSIGTMLLGYVVEKLLYIYKTSEEYKNVCVLGAKLSTRIGWFLLLVAYGVIARFFVSAAIDAGKKMPKFVWVIVISMFLLYSGFGVIQRNDMRKSFKSKRDKWTTDQLLQNGRELEMRYSVLSIIAKTVLVMSLFIGVASRTSSSL